MLLLDLPNELLLGISEYLASEGDINAVAQANRHLYQLLGGYLYRYNVQESGSSALLWAARHGQEATAQKSLRERANIQATNDKDGEAPLLLAAKNGHKQAVKLLLDKGANVNAQRGYYGNALQAASQRGHEAVVQLLLDKGANVNTQGGFHGNLLPYAANNPVGRSQPMRLCVTSEDRLLVHSHRLDSAHRDVRCVGREVNALQAASQGGHEAVVQLLLDKGANVNTQGGFHGNALQAALETGHDAVVKQLLTWGVRL